MTSLLTKKRDSMKLKKLTNVDFFDAIDTEEKAYWLGFIYADGHLHPSRPRRGGAVLTINLKAEDAHHLKRLADIFGRELKDRISRTCGCGKEHLQVRLDVCSNQIVQSIVSQGIPLSNSLMGMWFEKQGIQIPVAYKRGFSHNNCRGQCVRAGIQHWYRLYSVDRDGYDERV